MQTKLRAIRAYEDWEHDIGETATAALMRAYDLNESVTITGLEVDNGAPKHSYYNVLLADGTEIPAMAGMHLVDIDKYISKRGLQFSVELIARGPSAIPLDADALATMIAMQMERMLSSGGLAGFKLSLGVVQYQTEYPL